MEDINLEELKSKKNLLAFSAGTDSSALFEILLSGKIQFDLVIVDYGLREQSREEVKYAKSLAKKYSKTLYTSKVEIASNGSFEKKARDARYEYFDSIMSGYDNLILGHNLSDKTEWFLMQLTRGAGLRELYGMEEVSKRKNYTIVRPLLDKTKTEILEYLQKKDIKYFFDKSNDDKKYERNYFRHEYSENLLKEFSQGIKKTFNILKKEKELLPKAELVYEKEEYSQYKIDSAAASSQLSSILKRKGYLMSGSQREEFEQKDEITIIIEGQKITATYQSENLYISPYIDLIIPKYDREHMRRIGVPPKHRAYYYENIKL